MTKISVEDAIELLEKTGTKEWNESISKRLEPLSAYLDQDDWKKGIAPYLKALQGNAVVKMINESCPPDGINYLRGFIAGLRIVLCLPQSIESQIKQEQSKDNKGKPSGTAGY
jgi:hypothetical protein